MFIEALWIVQKYWNVPAFAKDFVNVKPFLLDVAEPGLPLAGVTLWGTPPSVHFQTTLPPFLMLTELGANELFFTATVFDEPACAGATATATPIIAGTAAAASLRSMGTPSGMGLTHHNPTRAPPPLFPRQLLRIDSRP